MCDSMGLLHTKVSEHCKIKKSDTLKHKCKFDACLSKCHKYSVIYLYTISYYESYFQLLNLR